MLQASSHLENLNSPGMQSLGSHPLSPPSGSSTPAWKSIFRIGNPSSKKLAAASISPLNLDSTSFGSGATSATLTPLATPGHSLTPPVDQRSSYNSSNTLSSDSNPAMPSRGPSSPSYFANYASSPDAYTQSTADAASMSRSRSKSKSDKQRFLGRGRGPQTADASQLTFAPTSTPSSRSGPLSPKAIGANATRFIRRVASAPNAKGLFSLVTMYHILWTRAERRVPILWIPCLPRLPEDVLFARSRVVQIARRLF